MSRTRYWLSALVVALLVGCAAQDKADVHPNVVLIILDDLGWQDTAIYGSTFYETPNIDRLAAESARFTAFYAAGPVCSPTRASIMTGKYPARLQITTWIGADGPTSPVPRAAEYKRQLALEEVTIGEAFRDAGYTTAYIGKWHLGEPPYVPSAQGFEHVVAVNHSSRHGSYLYPYRQEGRPEFDLPDLESGAEGEYLTDRLTAEAVSFLRSPHKQPFFLVLSHYAVHTPLQSKDPLKQKYEAKAHALPSSEIPDVAEESSEALTKLRQDHAVYAGVIESADESVGRLRAELAALDLADRTIVVFISDNGGVSTTLRSRPAMVTANVPLRAGKGWLYEGGLRTPLIVHWPNVSAGQTINVPAISTDLYPTLLDIAGLPLDYSHHVDGESLAPLINGSVQPPSRPLFWHFPHYHASGTKPSSAVRVGNYKLIEWLDTGQVELYDLTQDVGETRNLASELPAKVTELRHLLHKWRDAVGANMPPA